MSVPENIVTESSIAAPIGHAGVVAERRSAMGVRAWLLTAVLFLVPLVTYWPATFHDFGLRDDYSNLREQFKWFSQIDAIQLKSGLSE